MRALAALTVGATLASGGCYQPAALDARSVLAEVAADSPAPRRLRQPAEGHEGRDGRDGRDGRSSGDAAPGDGSATGSPGASTARVGEAGALTEDQAVARALTRNEDLRAERHQLGIAEGTFTAAGALANPTVEVELLHLEAYRQERATAIQLGWEPPQPAVYAAKRAAARAQTDAVKSEIAEAEWQLATEVRAAHASLLAIVERRALVERSLEKRRRIDELVEKRVRGGASTSIDLSLAQLSVAEMERQREALIEQELDGARLLGQLLGAGHPVWATGNGVPEETASLPSLDGLVDVALDARPALRAEEQRFQQREQTIRLENARRWPWFKLTSVPRYRFDSSDTRPRDFSVGVQLTLPILDQNAGPIRIAEATRDVERERFRQQAGSIRREVAAGLEDLALRRASMSRYRTSVLPGLDAHEKLLARAAEGGQIDLVAVLRAEDAILQSRSEFLAIRLAHHQAWLRLDRAVGRHVTGSSSGGPPPGAPARVP